MLKKEKKYGMVACTNNDTEPNYNTNHICRVLFNVGIHRMVKGEIMEYKLAKGRKDYICLICTEEIKKGEYHYVNHRTRLCALCYSEWQSSPIGTRLGNIPRSKERK